MTIDERHERFKVFFQEALEVIKAKSRDYEPSGIAYAKIKADAEVLGMTPQQLFGVFLSKQYSALQSYIKTGHLESEPIRQRLIDIANYAALIAVLLEDKQ